MSFNDDDKEKLTNTEDKENKEILNQDDEFEYVEVDENSDLEIGRASCRERVSWTV